MKKDINIPEVKAVHIAIVQEWNKEFLAKDWNAYLINNRTTPIETVLVVSKGMDGATKTSTMRQHFPVVAAKSAVKIEMLQEELLGLDNRYDVTFFAEGKLFDKSYLFKKNTVSERVLQAIPIVDLDGVLAE